ncbi:MAG: ammonia-forming cytochrome c nitrite reductase subunit c552 [Deltaproteobacteria bacterium]|nr:ammonia-forming cytochrome c nitrite reductase subunit c552 [Deltaproteobacteria bacterium]
MRPKGTSLILWAMVLAGMILLAGTCSPPKPEPVKTVTIPDGEYDPAVWGKAYPLEYDSWLKSKEPDPPGSKYRKGWTGNAKFDKLSEYPFMALLLNGWGFGVEYNEIRGHHYMLIDQLEIDPSRLKAGGVCLTCKTPFAPKLKEELGPSYFQDPYVEVHAKIPAQFQRMGVMCIDCHDNKTMDLKFSRWTLDKALADMGKDPKTATRQEKRSLVCAQCHVSYIIKKDKDMKSIDVFFPWQGSKEGDISIENIIKVIKSDPAYLEWKQTVTGFKLGFSRHPEYEVYTKNSTHWQAGVSCADCHMQYMRVGANKISNHNVGSPLAQGMTACQQCHAETAQWLKDRVLAIQDRTTSLLNRAGYATAVAAKLFEAAHQAQAGGKNINQDLYKKAKDLYEEAFYRINYIGAENSAGFHNPTEAGRICGDAVAFAEKSSALLRQALAQAGVEVPANVNLELAKYLQKRGVKGLNFKPAEEFKDPYHIQELLTPAASLGLPVAAQ